jgi:hypothetical protein
MQLQNKQKNPFYGMENTLRLSNLGGKGVKNLPIKEALAEADTPEKLGLVMTVIAQIGDVPGRTPLGLADTVDNGGYAHRELFRDTVIPTVLKNLRLKSQRLAFARLVVKYATADDLFATRVKTTKRVKGKSRVETTINMIQIWGVDILSQIAVELIKSPETAFLAAKWIIHPKFSKSMRDETRLINENRFELLQAISKKMNWEVKTVIRKDGAKYVSFLGYRAWKKEYSKFWESYIFSSGEILELDQEQIFELFERLPNDARGRVKMRIKSDKWSKLRTLFEQWEQSKKTAQKEVRNLTQELKVAKALGEHKEQENIAIKLAKAKKAAKVNAGSASTTQFFNDAMAGKFNELQLEAFISKMKNEFSSLVIGDISGSMRNEVALPFMAFIASLLFRTNPNPQAQDLMCLFGSDATWYSGITEQTSRQNSLMVGNTVKVNKPLYVPEDSFPLNYRRMLEFVDSKVRGGTYVHQVAESINRAGVETIEAIKAYPVWFIISDGHFNNRRNNTESLAQLLKVCDNKLGFRPYIIIIDVERRGHISGSKDITVWEGLDQVMSVPPTPENLELILTNFQDVNTFDSYTILESLSKSNRYAWIREQFSKL